MVSPLVSCTEKGWEYIHIPVVSRSAPPRQRKEEISLSDFRYHGSEVGGRVSLSSTNTGASSSLLALESCSGDPPVLSRYRVNQLKRKDLPVRKAPTTDTTDTLREGSHWPKMDRTASSSSENLYEGGPEMLTICTG
mmetsp:Transcript_27414/g.54848  ORF Transcript_27414/g.54848 Transcript_27414/m.54848 type:complete len:137 (-) Transcript_27414:280-690(-)